MLPVWAGFQRTVGADQSRVQRDRRETTPLPTVREVLLSGGEPEETPAGPLGGETLRL